MGCLLPLVRVGDKNKKCKPQSLHLSLVAEAGTTDDVSTMYGLRTRFSVQSSTEYTLHSGALHHDDEQDTWQDLLLSRKAQILWQGQWTDIVVTKSNFTRQRQQFRRQNIEISFQTANPLMIL